MICLLRCADLEYREIDGSVKQMVLNIPYLAAGEECHAITTFEITRHALVGPENGKELSIPKKLDKNLRGYLAVSPGIEARSPKLRTLAKDVTKGKDQAWEKVEAIYEWVRENVKYVDGDFKGAHAGLEGQAR